MRQTDSSLSWPTVIPVKHDITRGITVRSNHLPLFSWTTSLPQGSEGGDMTGRHDRASGAPTGAKPQSDRVGLRLAAMIIAIVALAPPLRLLGAFLLPDRIPPWPGAVRSPRAGPDDGTCPNGQGCAHRPSPRTTDPVAAERDVAAARLFGLVNSERRRADCPVLRLDERLTGSARDHAADMATREFASQTNPDRDGPDARARRAGYAGEVSELIAAGLPTADEVFAQWTNPHNPASTRVREKMTDCSRVTAGIAYHPGRARPAFGKGIWVLDLGQT